MKVEPITVPSALPARGQARATKILQAAIDLFLKLGYERTSMDAVIQRAGGSKSTLYRLFPTKAALFEAVVEFIVAQPDEVPLNIDDDIRETLTRFARERMKVVSSPQHIALVRLIVSESEKNRFSSTAKMYWILGPERRLRRLTRYFAELKHSGRLNIDDSEEAASFFTAALMNPWYIKQLLAPSKRPSSDELREQAARTIDRFLKLYLPPKKTE